MPDDRFKNAAVLEQELIDRCRVAGQRASRKQQDPAALQAGAPADVVDWSRANLDKSKQDVVRRALGSQDLLFVQGPPGTGKTTVIVEIVQQTIKLKPDAHILIVSQTHIAVDNALERPVSKTSSGSADQPTTESRLTSAIC